MKKINAPWTFSSAIIFVVLTVLIIIFKQQDTKVQIITKNALTSIKGQALSPLIKTKPSKSKNENDLQKERVYTETEIKEMTEEKFVDLLNDLEKRLPLKSDLKSLPAASLHHTPALILMAGRDLGLIKEVLKFHPNFEMKAESLYLNCAKNEWGVTPIRALCLTNLWEIKKRKGQTLKTYEYPEQIVNLAKMVIDI
jgi:hypothetical protein